MEKKIAKRYVDTGFGFPVVMTNVPMVKVRGQWTPDIDYGIAERCVLLWLTAKPQPLTGNEVRFLRQHFGMTLARFGKRFGVTHSAVLRWEKSGDSPTGMRWATEKDIRLCSFDRMKPECADPEGMAKLYRSLERERTGRPEPLVEDARRFAAHA